MKGVIAELNSGVSGAGACQARHPKKGQIQPIVAFASSHGLAEAFYHKEASSRMGIYRVFIVQTAFPIVDSRLSKDCSSRIIATLDGDVAELADAHDLGSCGAIRGGSSPPVPTGTMRRLPARIGRAFLAATLTCCYNFTQDIPHVRIVTS
jgi:hypothetical protein